MPKMDIFFPSSKHFSMLPSNGQVAIITRTKDRPVLLARAFASMLAQSYPHWHLYLVNDGGDPEPVDSLVEEYRHSFAGRISVFHHEESQGMESASNTGLSHAKGEYVIIHDDDDSWKPDFLAQAVSHLGGSSNSYAAVATNCHMIHEQIDNDEVVECGRFDYPLWKGDVDFLDLLRLNYIPPICLLIRKSVVDSIGPFNDNLPVLGDWDYILRIMVVGDVATINKELANYHHRIPQGETSHYSNSIIGGKTKHEEYQVLYRNSLIRKVLQRDPAFVGILHPLLVKFDQLEQKQMAIHWDVNHQPITACDVEKLRMVVNAIYTALRPIRWFWRRLHPLRRVIAKLRGKA